MYTENTKIKEIMHLPKILKIVEKYTGKRMSISMLRMGAELTIKSVGDYLHWTKAQTDAVLKELNDLENR